MNALNTWSRWGVWIFAVGGALWMLKVALIALNDALDRDPDALPVPVFYVAAVLLLVVGSTGTAMALVRSSRWWMQLIAAVAGIVGVFLLYSLLDVALKAAVGDAGPSWLEDELGIFATGMVALIGGVLLARKARWDGP